MFAMFKPKVNPPAGSKLMKTDVQAKQDVFTLDEGQVVLQWPPNLSPESFQDLKDWLELQLRKIGRAVVRDVPKHDDSAAE